MGEMMDESHILIGVLELDTQCFVMAAFMPELRGRSVQVIFFIPFLSIVTDAQDATSDVYGIGKVMFIGIIGVVSWEIALISRFWTWIFMLVWALSYAITFPFLLALGALFATLHVYDSSQASSLSPQIL